MEIKGRVIAVGKTNQVTEKLSKREIIIEYGDNPQYLSPIKFEAINDRCKLFDNVRANDDVEVHFNLSGREYTDKTGTKNYFNQLTVWKIDVLNGNNAPDYNNQDDDSDGQLPF